MINFIKNITGYNKRKYGGFVSAQDYFDFTEQERMEYLTYVGREAEMIDAQKDKLFYVVRKCFNHVHIEDDNSIFSLVDNHGHLGLEKSLELMREYPELRWGINGDYTICANGFSHPMVWLEYKGNKVGTVTAISNIIEWSDSSHRLSIHLMLRDLYALYENIKGV